MIEEYLKTWKSFFELESLLSRKNYWVYVSVNFLFLILLIRMLDFLQNEILDQMLLLIYFLVLISAGIRRMNDIKKRWFYIFIPFYNFVLLLEKSVNDSNPESFNLLNCVVVFFKLLLYSLVVGVVNFLIGLLGPFNNSAPYKDYIVLIYCVCLIPLFIVLFYLLTIIFKNKITKDSLFSYFLYFLFFSCVFTLLLIIS
ncbi:DUF805 domain-containing protein [Flavobacterium sp. PL002]|uniref:DUF805 domain-containing protein n=1 Tax=Flavobacterium sp. PL002 TaxID=1897058 RepID=UPI00178810D1|nr:hypothetical protein [Flavobacterium sp. PL002]